MRIEHKDTYLGGGDFFTSWGEIAEWSILLQTKCTIWAQIHLNIAAVGPDRWRACGRGEGMDIRREKIGFVR